MADVDIYNYMNDGVRSFLTLRAITQQIRAEVTDTFNFSVPFHLHCSWEVPYYGVAL